VCRIKEREKKRVKNALEVKQKQKHEYQKMDV
jgi:hypothetical protein